MDRLVLLGLIVAGAVALALWSFTYFAARRPRGFGRAAAHVVLAYCVVHTSKPAVALSVTHIPHPFDLIVSLAVITLPAFAYLLLSWLWLLACVRDIMSGPGSGHPVRVREPKRVPS